MQQANKINVADLPLNQAIKHVKGNGKRVLYVLAILIVHTANALKKS